MYKLKYLTKKLSKGIVIIILSHWKIQKKTSVLPEHVYVVWGSGYYVPNGLWTHHFHFENVIVSSEKPLSSLSKFFKYQEQDIHILSSHTIAESIGQVKEGVGTMKCQTGTAPW